MKKLRILILCGGKSAENEISIKSARHIVDKIDRQKFITTIIGIDKNGNWQKIEEQELTQMDYFDFSNKISPITFLPEGEIYVDGDVYVFDVVFPVLHGPNGEDGIVQGFLKMLNIPCVGSDVSGSAICMDKDIAKRLLNEAGIKNAKAICINSRYSELPTFKNVIEQLGLPVFIKPSRLGSSIGISKIKNEEEYLKAINEALLYDSKIIIEEMIDGREIECAILEKSSHDIIISQVGEIIPHYEFYSYKAKYIDRDGASFKIPAELPTEIQNKIRECAKKVFTVLNARGFARVDFFLTASGEIYVNEINTIPGFTEISMYPKLIELEGISSKELISFLIMSVFS